MELSVFLSIYIIFFSKRVEISWSTNHLMFARRSSIKIVNLGWWFWIIFLILALFSHFCSRAWSTFSTKSVKWSETLSRMSRIAHFCIFMLRSHYPYGNLGWLVAIHEKKMCIEWQMCLESSDYMSATAAAIVYMERGTRILAASQKCMMISKCGVRTNDGDTQMIVIND